MSHAKMVWRLLRSVELCARVCRHCQSPSTSSKIGFYHCQDACYCLEATDVYLVAQPKRPLSGFYDATAMPTALKTIISQYSNRREQLSGLRMVLRQKQPLGSVESGEVCEYFNPGSAKLFVPLATTTTSHLLYVVASKLRGQAFLRLTLWVIRLPFLKCQLPRTASCDLIHQVTRKLK